MTPRSMARAFWIAFALSLTLPALSACDNEPAEEAGEAVEETGDAMEEGAEDAGDAAEDAAD